jgi:hypothetical protein
MSKQRPSAEQLAELIAQPHFGRTREVMPSTDPIQPTAMVVSVDEIDVYDHNPRQLANDRYDEIKASIRASGMEQTLTIIRRPGYAALHDRRRWQHTPAGGQGAMEGDR